jgi:hypothetical protein
MPVIWPVTSVVTEIASGKNCGWSFSISDAMSSAVLAL